MASQMVIVRFPSGETEFQMTAEAPKVGDMVRRGGNEWQVEEVGADENDRVVVTLAPAIKLMNKLDSSGAGVARLP
jgi:hypothetical protein